MLFHKAYKMSRFSVYMRVRQRDCVSHSCMLNVSHSVSFNMTSLTTAIPVVLKIIGFKNDTRAWQCRYFFYCSYSIFRTYPHSWERTVHVQVVRQGSFAMREGCSEKAHVLHAIFSVLTRLYISSINQCFFLKEAYF